MAVGPRWRREPDDSNSPLTCPSGTLSQGESGHQKRSYSPLAPAADRA